MLDEGCEKALAAGDVRSSQLKRSREVLQRAEEESVPDHVWKRFSPEVVDHTKCLARTWGGGRGSQCPREPVQGRSLCRMHCSQGTLSHGLVDSAIPYGKLQEFLKHEARREHKLWQRADGVVTGVKPRGDRRKRHWYSRSLL